MAGIYTVLMHAASNTRFAVYKTTGNPNDQGTWAVVANSEIDFTDEVYSLWAVKDGTHIHIVTQEINSGRVAYHDFNTGSDTWTTADETVDASTSGSDDAKGCSIALRSDGDVIVIYHDAGVSWGREEGAGWTTSALGEAFTIPGVLVKGSSDRIHALYMRPTGTEILSRTIRSDNSLSTETQAHADVNQGHGVGPGISYDDDGTQRCRVSVRDSVSTFGDIIEWDSADSPTFNISEGVGDFGVAIENNTAIVSLSVDQKDLQLFGVNTFNNLFFNSNDDDAGWGTTIPLLPETTTWDGLSLNVITRGG